MIIKALSSQGNFDFDAMTGIVIKHNLTNMFGDLPYRVDTFEYFDHYNENIASKQSIDILDIGFWTLSGVYKEPNQQWRYDKDIKEIILFQYDKEIREIKNGLVFR